MTSTRPAILFLLCVLALIGAVPQPDGPAAAAATGATITFEESIPQPGSVLNQYCNNAGTNQGIEFLLAARIIDPPVETSSPTHVLTNEFPGQEFEEFDVIQARFTSPQDAVSVNVGLDRSHTFSVTAYLRAYRTETPAPGNLIEQSSLTLGTGPLSVTNVLSVADADGQIRSIEIEFLGSQPGYAAIEVIDDLSYPVVGGPCISDGVAPAVTITEPHPGEPIYAQVGSPATSLLGFTASDVGSGVAAVEVAFLNTTGSTLESFHVCGGGTGPCELPPSGVNRTFYTSYPFATKTIRVSAWDYAGNLGYSDHSTTVVESQLNVWAYGMEVTQAVQPWVATNTDSRSGFTYDLTYSTDAVPLVADRTTVVRVYPGVEGTYNGQALPNVRASLRCFTSPAYWTPCPGPAIISPQHDPARSLYAEITAHPGAALDDMRADITRSWNFVLPAEWTTDGQVYLQAEVLAPDGASECLGCADAANALRVSGVWFGEVPDFGDDLVHFVTIQWQKSGTITPIPPGTYTPTQAEINDLVDYARKVFPVDETTIPTTAHATYVLTDDDNWDLDHRCDRVTGLLAGAFGNRAGKEAVFGFFDSLYPCSGRGGGGYSYSRALPSELDAFPHEVGHAVGLKHPGSPPGPPAGHNAECENASWCDTDWPYPHGSMGDTYGFDVFDMEVIDPGSPPSGQHTHDLMSYGDPVWISDRNWIRMYNAFTNSTLSYPKAFGQPAWQETAAESGTILWVRGAWDAESGWVLAPAYELPDVRLPSDGGRGDYRIELRGNRGQLLEEHSFAIPTAHVDMGSGEAMTAPPSFSELVPLPDGVTTISLHRGEETLANRIRSLGVPRVTLNSPTREGLSRDRVAWEATDPDRDAELYALIEYNPSTDPDEWIPLATDIAASTLLVDFPLPGSSAGRVRVLVTDGLNTTAVVSPTFVVDDQPPVADILTDGTTIRLGDRLVVRGTASDLEDGLLTGSSLSWLSDQDGPLGTGSRLEVPSLTEGGHEIVLFATDSRGQESVDVIFVLVEEVDVPNHQPTAEAGPPELLVNGMSTSLVGSRSHDADGDPLTYSWSVVSQPRGSNPVLSSSTKMEAGLSVDVEGVYQVALTVNDGELDSLADTVTIDFSYEPTRVLGDIGLVNPESGEWHLWPAAGGDMHFYFGTPGDVPIMGDWDCDGVETPGLYRESDGYVYLVDVNATGVATIRFHLGNPGDIPLAGDFDGNGCDSVSVYRPSEGRVYLTNQLGVNEGWFVAERDYYFGVPGDMPFVGDFDGDGADTVGLHRESTGYVYFLNRHATAVADSEFFYGIPGDRLLAGDWNGDGADSVAVFRPSEGRFYFRFANTQGFADVAFDLGDNEWLPLAGRFE